MPNQDVAVREPQVNAAAPLDLLGTVLAEVQQCKDPALLREFLAFGKELEAVAAKREYIVAFQAAKVEMDGIRIKKRGGYIVKNKDGSRGEIKFAKYEDIADVVKPILARHELTASYSYELIKEPPKVVAVMTLMHSRGHAVEFRSVPMPLIDDSGGKNPVQGAGSISSYGRRYVICPAFDIVTEDEDDDGTGRGVPENITEDQAETINNILNECEGREAGCMKRFLKWLALEFRVQSVRELAQGDQLDAVMQRLSAKQKALGMR